MPQWSGIMWTGKGQEASSEAQNISKKCYQPHNLSCVLFYLLTESVGGVGRGLRNTSFIWEKKQQE